MRYWVIALALVLGSCRGLAEPASCGAAVDCLASEPGVVIGRDASARLAARRELLSAAASYSAWFQGRKALPGLIVLDLDAAREASYVRGTSWTLKYDLAAKRAIDGGSSLPRSNAADTGAGVVWGDGAPVAASRDNSEFDPTRPGVLAHEICHRHASRAFRQAWGRQRTLPDMLDEVAAISCETGELRRARLELFVGLFNDGKTISWEGFLVAKHPLKSDPAMIRALKRLSVSGRSAVTFDIKPGSSYAARVALFYSQAAAFGEFLTTRSCKGRRAIGDLLTTYDPRGGLDRWLHIHAAGLCLPGSVKQFGQAFEQFVRQTRSAERLPANEARHGG